MPAERGLVGIEYRRREARSHARIAKSQLPLAPRFSAPRIPISASPADFRLVKTRASGFQFLAPVCRGFRSFPGSSFPDRFPNLSTRTCEGFPFLCPPTSKKVYDFNSLFFTRVRFKFTFKFVRYFTKIRRIVPGILSAYSPRSLSVQRVKVSRPKKLGNFIHTFNLFSNRFGIVNYFDFCDLLHIRIFHV